MGEISIDGFACVRTLPTLRAAGVVLISVVITPETVSLASPAGRKGTPGQTGRALRVREPARRVSSP